jgi:hypothetical protein
VEFLETFEELMEILEDFIRARRLHVLAGDCIFADTVDCEDR